MDTGDVECLGHRQGGIEAFVLHGAFLRGFVEAAFQIREHDIGRLQRVLDLGERDGGIGDPHQVDVADQNHLMLHCHAPI